MTTDAWNSLRIPLAVGLVAMLVVAFLVLRRVDAGTADPGDGVVVGAPGGGILATSSAAATASPAATSAATPPGTSAPSPTPSPTATPTPTPAPVAGFSADVRACREISGPECVDELDRLSGDDRSFVALVLFEGAVAGDVLNVVLDGPSGPIEGGSYTLPGSGRGYYYATISFGELPRGEYTLTALRNGEAVAATDLRRNGRGDDDDDDD
jgi:hypothetical protein